MPEQNEIIEKKELAPRIKELVVYAPFIARSAKPGQFVMVVPHEKGERIPLTLVDWSEGEGWIKLVFLEVGVSTIRLGKLEEGDKVFHIAGPLGNPSVTERYGTAALIGGGVANAALYPIARVLRSKGNEVVAVIGARTASMLIYERELREVCSEVHVATDDGSVGFRGFVSQLLDSLVQSDYRFDVAWIIGPAPMMKACTEVTKRHGIRAYASLNPLMVCGIGMCGTCRVTVSGRVRFACLEGPEFDAHEVDWDELISRLNTYREEERLSLDLLYKGLEVEAE
uniref:Sulfide/dihydroorotate dehydrogenase-like FAD/NAD-binding protein n=1 Tax=Fervidicoccus fontis TaxID=683846 RepID=A0A7J3ZL12_9CREN